MHIPEVVFALVVVEMVLHELVFIREFEEDGEEDEEFGDDVGVALSAEGFDFFDVVLQDGWVETGVVAVD